MRLRVRILKFKKKYWVYRPYTEGPPVNGKLYWKEFNTLEEAEAFRKECN